VEAAGVEPASEIGVRKETPCSVAFHWISQSALRSDKIRRMLVCESHSRGPDPAEGTSLLYDVLPRPAGEASEDGSLFN